MHDDAEDDYRIYVKDNGGYVNKERDEAVHDNNDSKDIDKDSSNNDDNKYNQ